jgi:glycosyltransferase involved in cell wall biosynthesis
MTVSESMEKKNMVMVLYGRYMTDARVKKYVDALVQSGWDVHVICLRESGTQKTPPGVFLYHRVRKYQGDSKPLYLWSYAVFFLTSFFQVTRLLLKGKCQFVHVHNMPNFIVYTALLPKIAGVRIILDLHDTMPELYAAKFSAGGRRGLLFRILVWEELWSARLADFVIATSEVHREMFIAHGIPRDKISVVMNVANEKWFPGGPKRTRRGDDDFRFIYHGTISYRLGLDIALRAFAMAQVENPRIRFSIVGEGDYLQDLLLLAEQLHIEGPVSFTRRFVPVEELSGYIAGADAGVIANRSDGAASHMLPVKLLEYVHLQKPCIAPRIPSIQHYFDETMVGYFDPENIPDLADKMVRMSNDASWREGIVQGANRFNATYNWKSQKEVYLSIVGNSHPPHGERKRAK